MTDWDDSKTIIRRFLRDPDGNIWDDAYLLNLWNTEQRTMQNMFGLLEDVQSVRVPGTFEDSYMHDFEWARTSNSDGEVYRCFYLDDPTDYVFTHIWESQHLEDLTPDVSALGENYTHPWEAFMVGTPAEQPPIQLPNDFHTMKFAAYDKDPVYPSTNKEVAYRDQSWRQRTGEPYQYYRDSTLESRIYLYPTPSGVTWQDNESRSADPDSAEYASTSLDVDNNLLVIYDYEATDISAGSDESDFPEFVRKFIGHGVISRAYRANTDGRIKSLADYWQMRRKVGDSVIQAYRSNRRVDREYCLASQQRQLSRSRRHPRLPDEYPPQWP